jgi:hypothetical protein
LLGLHQEGFPAPDRGAGAVRTAERRGRSQHYQFNTGTSKHTFCRHCGIHSFYVPRSDPDKVDVNVRCLDDVDLAVLSIAPFDGRNMGRCDRRPGFVAMIG